MSSVTATVPAYREAELISGYREMNDTDDKPDGLLRPELHRGQNGRWLIGRCGAIAKRSWQRANRGSRLQRWHFSIGSVQATLMSCCRLRRATTG
jgi:hypothetical protein